MWTARRPGRSEGEDSGIAWHSGLQAIIASCIVSKWLEFCQHLFELFLPHFVSLCLSLVAHLGGVPWAASGTMAGSCFSSCCSLCWFMTAARTVQKDDFAHHQKAAPSKLTNAGALAGTLNIPPTLSGTSGRRACWMVDNLTPCHGSKLGVSATRAGKAATLKSCNPSYIPLRRLAEQLSLISFPLHRRSWGPMGGSTTELE